MDVLENMKAFVLVARLGSFTAAAKSLGVANSVVTKRVEQFERRSGTPLFSRTTRKVTLTDKGAAWLVPVESALDGVDRVLDGMSRSDGELRGHVRLKVPTTLALFYFSAALMEFQSLHSNVTLDIILNDRFLNPVEEDFDVVIAGLPGTFAGVKEFALCRSRRLLCATPSYVEAFGTPRHPRELTHHRLLTFTPMGTSFTFESHNDNFNIDVQPSLRSNDGQVILAAALASKGIALLAEYGVRPSIEQGKLAVVLADFTLPAHWLRAIVPSTKSHAPHILGLVEHLRRCVTPTPPWE